jgi:predicted AlkP superfamily pyrophosphatase or phosphodiesterase
MVVDQGRQDYFERYASLYEHGFARLLNQGAVFTQTHHEHAVTNTAPGHATISTGTTPAHHGVVGNYWYDRARGQEIYSAGYGAPSPENLKTSTLADWLRANDRASKVYSASVKDRSAVLMGGRAANGAYWYFDDTGEWESSSAYQPLPGWLEQFNERRLLDRFFGGVWKPLEGAPTIGTLGIEDVDTGAYDFTFPHELGGWAPVPDDSYYTGLQTTPFVDWYLGELGKEIVEREQLGADGSVDLLALSFSALDYVGHDYGPDSPEVVDILRRLDRVIGDLLDFLDDRLGPDGYVAAFSADHGVVRLPEIARARGVEARRLGADDRACIQQAGVDLEERLGPGRWFEEGLYLDADTLERNGVSRAVAQREAAELIERCEAVAKIWTAVDLMAEPAGPVGEAERRFRASFDLERSPDLMIQFKPHYLLQGGLGTTHGSAYGYDSRVPMIFLGAGVAAGVHEQRAATVDIAPTLATLVGVPVPDHVDGTSRAALARR